MDDFTPIDSNGKTFVDQMHSKAYLRHLFTAGEMLGPIIATMHNLGFYLWLVDEAAKNIENNTFADWKNAMIPKISARL
jgi:queuine tRNA-ribosyltransferase